MIQSCELRGGWEKTETEIRVGEMNIETKSIPEGRKSIFRDWGQESLRNLKWYSLARMEREREKGGWGGRKRERLRLRKRNGSGWEEDCLMRGQWLLKGG